MGLLPTWIFCRCPESFKSKTVLLICSDSCTSPDVCFCPHHQTILGHQLSILKFNSILTLSTWTQHQTPQVKGSVPPAPSDANQDFRLSPVLLTDIDQRSQGPLLGFDELARATHRTWRSISLTGLPVYYKRI